MSMYGLALRSDPETEIQEWEETYDVDDMLKPETMFIPCRTMDEGLAILKARHPVPERLKECLASQSTMTVDTCQLYRNGGAKLRVRTYPRARVTSMRKYGRSVEGISELVQGLIALGGGVIGYSGGSWDVASHHQIVNALRRNSLFAASDLVIRQIKDSDDLEVVVNPKKAKARKTRAVTQAKKGEEENAARIAANSATERRKSLYSAARAASAALWDSIPALKELKPSALNTAYYYSSDYEQLTLFWRVVFAHETFGRKGKWRDEPAVDSFIDEYSRRSDAFDDKYLKDAYNVNAEKQIRTSFERLEKEAQRLARKRRREQCKREREAKKPSEPAAV